MSSKTIFICDICDTTILKAMSFEVKKLDYPNYTIPYYAHVCDKCYPENIINSVNEDEKIKVSLFKKVWSKLKL